MLVPLTTDFLLDGCQAFIRNACTLLRTTGAPVTADNVLALLESAPKAEDDLRNSDWFQRSFCFDCLVRFREKARNPEQRVVSDYFLLHLPRLHRASRDMLEQAFQGILGSVHLLDKGQ